MAYNLDKRSGFRSYFDSHIAMEQYDFIKEELKSLIRTIKRQDYKLGKYLVDHLLFDKETGGVVYTGDDLYLNKILTKVVVKESSTPKS